MSRRHPQFFFTISLFPEKSFILLPHPAEAAGLLVPAHSTGLNCSV